MTPEFVTGFFWEAIKITISLAAPMLIVGLVAGVLVSMFQAATQINEQTLSFIPKLGITFVVLIIGGPWLLKLLMTFTQRIISDIPMIIG